MMHSREIWLPILATIAGAALIALGWFARRRNAGPAWARLVFGGLLAAFGIGGLFPFSQFGSVREPLTTGDIGFWVAVAALALFAVKCAVLILSGRWYAWLAATIAGAGFVGLGLWIGRALGSWFITAGDTLWHLEVAQPWWLLLLLLIPVVVWMSYRSLAGLGPTRRWLAIGPRSLLIALFTFALARIPLPPPNQNTTCLVLVDRSLSIPQEIDPKDDPPVDRRWQRIKKFVADATARRGPGHERDQAGVIVFGRRPRLALPASDVPVLVLEDSTLGS